MLSETEFATAGVKTFKSWTFQSGTLKSKKGAFGRGAKRYNDKAVSLEVMGSYYLTGSIKGDLIVWSGNGITKMSKRGLFSRPLDALHVTQEFLYAGDRSGKVMILNQKFDTIQEF